MEFRYERYQALDRVAWINYQAKGIQATKMIRGFLRLLLIASAVAALAAENSAVPAATGCEATARLSNRPTGILNRPASIINRPTGIGPRRAA